MCPRVLREREFTHFFQIDVRTALFSRYNFRPGSILRADCYIFFLRFFPVSLCMDLDCSCLYNTKRRKREQMERYRLSFTFGSLLIHETGVIATKYVKDRDWEAVKGLNV